MFVRSRVRVGVELLLFLAARSWLVRVGSLSYDYWRVLDLDTHQLLYEEF